MTEEVEVNIKSVEEEGGLSGGTLVDALRRLLLASIGAVALTRDEAESFINKLVERGELAQKDAEGLVRELQGRMRQRRSQVRNVGERMESGVEELLNRLNIPSKRDIDDLSAKIAQLSARVEELRKQQ